MRTAEEIFQEKLYFNKWMMELTDNEKSLVITIINDARREAIEECASIGEKNNTYYGYYSDGTKKYIADKQSILSLISELK